MENHNIEHYHFQEMVKQTERYIYSLAYRLTGSAEDAKDLTQESYLKALKSWSQFNSQANPIPWVRKICINAFIDIRRKSERSTFQSQADPFVIDHKLATDTPSPVDELLTDERVREINSRCFTLFTQQLPLYQKIVFVLIDIFQLSIDETAALIRKSKSATKAILYRAREKTKRSASGMCSLVIPQNFCNCNSWVTYADNAQKRRDYLHSVLIHSNPDAQMAEDAKRKLIILFNHLPLIQPFDNWFEEVKNAFK